ncbi:glycosyl transferase family 2 [Candidatus Omnitrophus magneticus]|uniref:Glycosyl transferase family 2 n=1 Tax=Candidatus Omnitrophus magneticus TaxID=1609969 RepID=A0A0F0CVU2_9BACT|nr:glycosyl transferase family 2 [Candidatus Omnitrophus magneticus]
MISIQNISKQYAGRELFSEVSFDVRQGEKIGLVGRNGHGKSTLLRIITAKEEADEGRIIVPKGYTIGYLEQILNLTQETVLEEASLGLRPTEKDAAWKVKKILSGLGFTDEDFNRPPAYFSGGYQMRISLAKVLAGEPNMLLLDEPTNFLDIVSIRWLEKFLKAWRNELIIISHDRSFIDSVTTHIVGIHRAGVRKMQGKTAKYYEQLYMEEEIHEQQRVNDEKKRKQIMEYVTAFRAKARRAKSVQSSLKRLDKMEKLDKLDNINTLTFSFNYSPIDARKIMDVHNLTFSYDAKEPYLINSLNFSVDKHDKICIIGKNGKGKTTLLKLLAGRLNPISGKIKTHYGVLPAYYEQANTVELNENATVEEEISLSKSFQDKTTVRAICGAMMFPGDDAFKKIKVLSGGERSRVLLGKQLTIPSNILLLDEPTHHLDMESCQAIALAVRDYEGAALIVTHDEYFLNEVATKLIVFQGDEILFYPGTYEEFIERIGWKDEDKKPNVIPAAMKEKKPDDKKNRAAFLALKAKTLKPLEENINIIEKNIITFEARLKEVHEELIKASHEGNGARIAALSKEMNSLNERVNELFNELQTAMDKHETESRKFIE